MPYETVDYKDNAIFKIGMTLDFEKRVDQYHTYFPNGVYNIAFLTEPFKTYLWTKTKKKEWKAKYGNNGLSLAKALKIEHFKKIESTIFQYIKNNNGIRIHSTARIKKRNENKEGETEWVYTNTDLIHDAFEHAQNIFGGTMTLYHLSGIVSNTGTIVQSINQIALQNKTNIPNYTGQISHKL